MPSFQDNEHGSENGSEHEHEHEYEYEYEYENEGEGVTTLVPQQERKAEKREQRQPRYNVLLWDSDVHTFDYVQKMLRELFGHNQTQCKKIADQVDADGKAVVLTTTREHAELKCEQIHAYGKDEIQGTTGSMWSTIEPVA